MKLSRFLDALIEPFAPRMVHNRIAWRQANEIARQYDGAAPSRRTMGWRRGGTSANAEVQSGLVGLRNGARELVRNNNYASAAIRQLTAHIVGNGFTITARHSDPAVQKAAQDYLDELALSRIDGRNDWYSDQKIAVRAWLEGGESLIIWSSKDGGLNNHIRVVEGDYLDHTLTKKLDNGGEIVQGVEFNADGILVAYWLFDQHPGDTFGYGGKSKRWSAEHIDHVYEELRPGQVRGVSVLAPVMIPLKDLGDLDDAITVKKKTESCLALVLTPGETNPAPGPFDPKEPPQENPNGGPYIETLRPGMIMRTKPGDTVNTVTPSSTGDGVEFITKKLMGIGAVTVPYHMLAGDPSKANYSSTRAAMLGFWPMLDDWQDNVVVPFIGRPFFERAMKTLFMRTGDKRFLAVTAEYTMPIRALVDPIKDLAGEVAEVRAGFNLHSKPLARRGMTVEAFAAAKAAENKTFDDLGIIVETDPRRVTDSGILQAAVGYIAPKADKPAKPAKSTKK